MDFERKRPVFSHAKTGLLAALATVASLFAPHPALSKGDCAMGSTVAVRGVILKIYADEVGVVFEPVRNTQEPCMFDAVEIKGEAPARCRTGARFEARGKATLVEDVAGPEVYIDAAGISCQ